MVPVKSAAPWSGGGAAGVASATADAL
jgi:hypothetical protein